MDDKFNRDDWVLAAWLYNFEIDVDYLTEGYTLLEENEDYTTLNNNLLAITDVTFEEITENGDLASPLVEYFDKCGLTVQVDFFNLFQIDLKCRDLSPLKTCLNILSLLKGKVFEGLEKNRFLRKDLYFKNEREKFKFGRKSVKANRGKTVDELFVLENLGDEWVDKNEYYISNSDWLQLSFSTDEQTYALVRQCHSSKLVSFGRIFRDVRIFIEETTSLELPNVVDL